MTAAMAALWALVHAVDWTARSYYSVDAAAQSWKTHQWTWLCRLREPPQGLGSEACCQLLLFGLGADGDGAACMSLAATMADCRVV
jgi:hypothetical protein